jgi:hypothetical protein
MLRIRWYPAVVGNAVLSSDHPNIVPTQIVDITRVTEVDFTVPFLYPEYWCTNPFFDVGADLATANALNLSGLPALGYLEFTWIQTLVAPTDQNPFVNLTIYACCGPDAQVQIPFTVFGVIPEDGIPAARAAAKLKHEKTPLRRVVRPEGLGLQAFQKEFPPIMAGDKYAIPRLTISDRIDSIQTLLHIGARAFTSNAFSGSQGSTFNGSFWVSPYFIAADSWNMQSSFQFGDFASNHPLHTWTQLYQFWRGGFNSTIVPMGAGMSGFTSNFQLGDDTIDQLAPFSTSGPYHLVDAAVHPAFSVNQAWLNPYYFKFNRLPPTEIPVRLSLRFNEDITDGLVRIFMGVADDFRLSGLRGPGNFAFGVLDYIANVTP